MVKRNIIIAKAGGTAGKNSVNYKISLPAEMVKELNITQEDKSVIVSCIDGKIIIEKDNEILWTSAFGRGGNILIDYILPKVKAVIQDFKVNTKLKEC